MGLSLSSRALYDAARAVAARAHAPHSGLRVGAALAGAHPRGAVHLGVNVESASYRLTTCAEQAALARAVAEGEKVGIGALTAIAVARADDAPIVPCGACRQMLADLAPGIVVVHRDADGLRERPLTELLPEPFGL